jgi:hemolysin activation/secretion protein
MTGYHIECCRILAGAALSLAFAAAARGQPAEPERIGYVTIEMDGNPLALKPEATVCTTIDENHVPTGGLSRQAWQQRLNQIVYCAEQSTLNADNIETLRRRVTQAFVDLGEIASGAIVLKRNGADGTVALKIIQGRIIEIWVSLADAHSAEPALAQPVYRCASGKTRGAWSEPPVRTGLLPGGLRPGYVCDRLAVATEGPLNIDQLRMREAVLLQDPNIARLNVDVSPAANPGEAVLDASVGEPQQWNLFAGIANDQPPTVGAEHGVAGGSLRNLLHIGDLLSVTYGRTSGANLASAGYDIPVSPYDTRLDLHWSYNGAGVVAASYAGLGITSQYQSAGVSLTQPLLPPSDDHQRLEVSLGWDYTLSNQYILGQPFSFEPGYKNGEARAAAVRAGVEWSRRGDAAKPEGGQPRVPAPAFSLRVTLSHGLDMLGATNEAGAPNPGFLSLLGQGYAECTFPPLIGSLEPKLVGRTAFQVASQSLYSFERLAIGGPTSVRGYVQNALVLDEGVIGSAELRSPVWRRALPRFTSSDDDGWISIAIFADGGRGGNLSGPAPQPTGIASLGAGLRWDIGPGTAAMIYYGYALVRSHATASVLQPVSFALSMQF